MERYSAATLAVGGAKLVRRLKSFQAAAQSAILKKTSNKVPNDYRLDNKKGEYPMSDIFKALGWALLGLLALAGITFGLNAIGLASFSFWAPKYEEARREVVQQSIRRQEGVNEGLAALCLNMRTEQDPASKKAFANMIVVQAGATGTSLTADSLRCKTEAERELGL
jgi:hypothetical protein